jgi:hypothetical protein
MSARQTKKCATGAGSIRALLVFGFRRHLKMSASHRCRVLDGWFLDGENVTINTIIYPIA